MSIKVFEVWIVFFFVLSCITNGFYFLWIGILLMFPPIVHHQEKRYNVDLDIHFFLVIPCLNEDKVIANTINNLLSLKMPRTKIIVINDGSTDDTLEILNQIHSPDVHIVNRVLPNAKQGKGKALNAAFSDIRKIAAEQGLDHAKVVLGILDADTYIKRSLLERVAVLMSNDPKAGMVQTRVRIGITTRNYFLPLMQDIEFFSYINQMQNVREYMGTVAAAGNGQFNRLSAMEQLGDEPWSECLLEDFDFSLRLLLKGWRTRLLQDETIYQQGVIGYKKLVRQRSRWAQGGIQCLRYIKQIVTSDYLSFSGKVEIIYFMLLPWFGLMSIAAMSFSWFLILYTYWYNAEELFMLISSYSDRDLLFLLIVLLIFIYVPGMVFSISYQRDTKESLFRCLCAGLFIPIYNMLQMPAILIAMGRYALGNNSWVKTERVVN